MKLPLAAISRRARPPRLKPPLSSGTADSRRVPEGPGCSRWFSCTCCLSGKRRDGTKRAKGTTSWWTYLPIDGQSAKAGEPAKPSALPPLGQEDRPRSTMENVQFPPQALPLANQSRPPPPAPIPPTLLPRLTGTHLLLPPPLPYSPDSIPFKRHLQALSLTLGSRDPDESWEVYQALHDDLKKHISDDLYCSLVRHQLEGVQDPHGLDLEEFLSSFQPSTQPGQALSSPGSTQRLQRVVDLLFFARDCRMSFDRFPIDTLLILVSVDLRPLNIPLFALALLLRQIWKSLATKLGDDLSSVPASSRRNWIEMLVPPKKVKERRKVLSAADKARIRLWHAVPSKTQREERKLKAREVAKEEDFIRHARVILTFEALKYLAVNQSGRDLDEVIHRYILASAEKAPRKINRAFELLAKLAELEPEIPTRTTIRALMARLARLDQNHVRYYEGNMHDRITRIASLSPSISAYIFSAWSDFRVRFMPLTHQVEHLVGNTTLSIAKLTQTCIKCLYHTSLSGGDMRKAMDAALDLLWTIVWERRQESAPLTRTVIHHLCLSSDPTFYAERVQRLVRILNHSDTLNRLAPSSFAHLFALCLRSSTPHLFFLAIKLYTWDLKPPRNPKWMDWRKLPPGYFTAFLQFLLNLEKPHVSFASRIYTDYISAGLVPRTKDALALVRAITRVKEQSRNLLLERHIKDYLFLKLGPREELIETLIGGLLQTSKPDDAWLAFRVSNRINRGRFLSPQLIDQIIEVILLDPSLEGVARCAGICQRMVDPRSHYVLLMEFLSTEMEGTMEFTESRRRLALANHFYGDMVQRNLVPPPKFLSLLIREMAQAGETDLALNNYTKCLAMGIKMDDGVAATLIVRFSMKSQFDSAEQVEHTWIEQNDQYLWEKSEKMRGARAYLDTRRGVEVNAEGVEDWLEAARGWTVGVGGPRVEVSLAGVIGPPSDTTDEDPQIDSRTGNEKEAGDDQWEVVTQKVWKAGSAMDHHSSYNTSGLIFN